MSSGPHVTCMQHERMHICDERFIISHHNGGRNDHRRPDKRYQSLCYLFMIGWGVFCGNQRVQHSALLALRAGDNISQDEAKSNTFNESNTICFMNSYASLQGDHNILHILPLRQGLVGIYSRSDLPWPWAHLIRKIDLAGTEMNRSATINSFVIC